MSLSQQFQEQIDNYVNQMSAYKEEVDEYKNQLTEAKGQSGEFTKSLVTGIGIPIGTEIARMAATKLFGQAAGDQVANLAGSALKTVASGDTSSSGILANMRASLGTGADTAPATEAESALDSLVGNAKEGVMSVVNRIRGGAEDAVAGAEDAVAGVQETLTNATGDLISSVTNRVAGQVSNIVDQQVSRFTSLDSEGIVRSALSSADSPVTFPSSIVGDVEMSNFASAVPRSGIPDLSLPFESTYEAPLLSEPMSIPGVTSNIIGRLTSGTRQLFNPEVPDSVIPTQEEALDMLSQQVRPAITSDLLPQGAGSIEGTIGNVAEEAAGTIGETVGSLAQTATSAISGLAEQAGSVLDNVTSTVSSAVSTVGKVAEGVGEAVGEAGAEAGAEVAGGAAGGPAGLIIGGIIGLGTFLYDMFHHDHTAPTIAPIMPSISIPSFQPGLNTGD